MFSRKMLKGALRPTPVHNAGHELPELALDNWENAARCGVMIAPLFPAEICSTELTISFGWR